MTRDRFHCYFRLGRGYQAVALEWLPSWDHYDYPRFGAWWHVKRHGLTLRYRGWLLLVWWRR
jgi:hypothetical protein